MVEVAASAIEADEEVEADRLEVLMVVEGVEAAVEVVASWVVGVVLSLSPSLTGFKSSS